MDNPMWQRLIIITVFFLLSGVHTLKAQENPVAELITADKSVCESGNIEVKIRFYGTGPFNAEILYTNGNNELIERGWISISGIYEQDLVDGVYTLSRSFDRISHSNKVNIRIVAARNSSYPSPSFSTNVTGTAILTIDETPVPNAGVDQTVCGFSANLLASPSSLSNTYNWSVPAGLTFSDSNDPNATITASIAGSFTLRFIQTNGACESHDDVTINFNGSPAATISTSSEICREGMAEINIVLEGFGPWNVVYTDGTSNFPLTNQANSNINIPRNVIGQTTFTLVSVSDNNNCEAPSERMHGTATVVNLKPEANAGIDMHACGLSHTLNAEAPSTGNGTWKSTNALVQFASAGLPNSTVTVPGSGFHTFTWEVNNNGCIESDQVTIQFVDEPDLHATLSTSQICEGNSAILNISTNSQHAPWIIRLENNSSFEEINTATPNQAKTLSPLATTTYALTKITDKFGCNTSFDNLTFLLSVDKMPAPNAGADQQICGIQATLAASTPLNAGIWTIQSGDSDTDQFSDATSPLSTFTVNNILGHQAITLRWTETNGLCTAFDETTITFYQSPLQTDADAGSDMELYHKFSEYLNAKEPSFGQGQWTVISGNGSVVNANDAQSLVENLTFGTTTLRWSLTNGNCPTVSDEITIVVKGLKHPTGFSPNNDGTNDTFTILGASSIRNNELIVFNQAGEVVYKTRDFDNWDGNDLNNRPVPDGYYYFIFQGDGITPIKDFLVIKRSLR